MTPISSTSRTNSTTRPSAAGRRSAASYWHHGNNGPITPQGAAKASQFIQLCDQTNRPLLFLHNTTGFMVGTESEQNGVIKHGSKMIQAVANARVPKLSIVIGGSYGAGNYAMCGPGLDPRFIFCLAELKTAVMGGAQAGKVLRIVTEAKQAKMGMNSRSERARLPGKEHRRETGSPIHRPVQYRQPV
jgi:acetyl-CoA carboxylase carboxyltransferase component